jgi:hypothetical protein|tara:strand:- start:431 stop:748 length:318 start_codon:yes stop_codon:yes gene_type:complete
MRKETSKISKAFVAGHSAAAARTSTDGQAVWLHGNKIAWRKAHDIAFSLCGWGTPTTRDRINGILLTLGCKGGVYQRNNQQWLIKKDEVVPLDCYDTFYLSDLET